MARIVIVGSLADSLVNFRGPLIGELAARGHEVIGCAPNPSEALQRRLAELGARAEHVPIDNWSFNPLRDLQTLVALVRLFRRTSPDWVLAYTIKPVIYGGLAARLARVERRAALITGLGYAFRSRTGWLQRLVRRLYASALSGAGVVFFQNDDDRATFTAAGLLPASARVVTIPGSGVDTDHYAEAPLPARPAFLLIARLLTDKGIPEYVEAARAVRQDHPDVPFRIAGWTDRNPRAIPQSTIDRWADEGVIEFLGRLDDVRPELARCSIYVLPSHHEGTPRTVLEAMSTGRAVITTDAPGCRQTVAAGETGLLVPVGDAAALAAAMRRLLAEPATVERMGAAARRRALERYDVRIVNSIILRELGLGDPAHPPR